MTGADSERKLVATNRKARFEYEILDTLRGRHRAARPRGEVAARRQREPDRRLRDRAPRRGVPRERPHRPLRSGGPRERGAAPRAQAAAPPRRDRAARRARRRARLHAGAARALLQGRAREGPARRSRAARRPTTSARRSASARASARCSARCAVAAGRGRDAGAARRSRRSRSRCAPAPPGASPPSRCRTSPIAATTRPFARRTPRCWSRTTWPSWRTGRAGRDGRGDVLFLCRWPDARRCRCRSTSRRPASPIRSRTSSTPRIRRSSWPRCCARSPPGSASSRASCASAWSRDRRDAKLELRLLGEEAPAPHPDLQVLGKTPIARACRVRGGDPGQGRLDVALRGARGGALHRRLLRPAGAGSGRVDRAARDRARARHALAQPDPGRRDVRGGARPRERPRALDSRT